MTTYPIILERVDGGGWSASSPDLPGLLLAADTCEELLATVSGAIADHLDALRELRLPAPRPGEIELVRIAV